MLEETVVLSVKSVKQNLAPRKTTEIHKFSIFNHISSVNIKCGNDFKTKGVVYIHNKFVNEPKISKVVQVYIGLKHVTI